MAELSETKFKKYQPVEYSLPLGENVQKNYFELRIDDEKYSFSELGGRHFAYICAIKSDGEPIRDEPVIKFTTTPQKTFILIIRTASLLYFNQTAESNE